MKLDVAVAVILDEHQRILITRRPWDKSHGGDWEFPGGKLEANEDPQAALFREVQEEIGLQVVASEYLGDVNYEYSPELQVHLIVFIVTYFLGTPVCRENQLDLRWVEYDVLSEYQFPEANQLIIQLVEPVFRELVG